MSIINITNVTILDNPTSFLNPLQFEIQFECLQSLEEDLEWKVIYVANAEDCRDDQVLEEACVGPVTEGVHKFVLQAPAPSHTFIKNEDLIGVTVVLLTCSYNEQEFVRIGYYVNNEYGEEYDPDNLPNPIDINKLFRNMLADQPRVTRFCINWSNQPLPQGIPLPVDMMRNTNIFPNGFSSDNQLTNEMMEDENESGLETYGNSDDEDDDEDDDNEEDLEIDIDVDDDTDDEDEVEDAESEAEGADVEVAHSSANMIVIMNEDSMDVQQMQHFEGANYSNSSI